MSGLPLFASVEQGSRGFLPDLLKAPAQEDFSPRLFLSK